MKSFRFIYFSFFAGLPKSQNYEFVPEIPETITIAPQFRENR